MSLTRRLAPVAFLVLASLTLAACTTPTPQQACAKDGHQQGTADFDDCVATTSATYDYAKARARNNFGGGAGG